MRSVYLFLLALSACGESTGGGGGGVGPDAAAGESDGGVVDAAVPGDAAPVADERLRSIATGGTSSCGVTDRGRVKCWGENQRGQLGLGDVDDRGDDPSETIDQLPFVDLGTGRAATMVAVGRRHACARLTDGAVKCWGDNAKGELGLGDTQHRGDGPGEMGDALPEVDLGRGRTARAVAAGDGLSCALLDDGAVKCWGDNAFGQLGQGDVATRGDQPSELGDALPAIALGAQRTATAISAGWYGVCALLDDHELKCWGSNVFGELGLGDTNYRGDQPGEMGDALPAVQLGAGRTASAISCGDQYACAVLDDGAVKCWGDGFAGELGLGDTARRGEQPGEMGDALPAVDLGAGAVASAVSAGEQDTCAIVGGGELRCWGLGAFGLLGLGDRTNRGDQPGEMGAALPAVNLGTTVDTIAVGQVAVFARRADGRFVDWGGNADGELGLGHASNIGDDAAEMGAALVTFDGIAPIAVGTPMCTGQNPTFDVYATADKSELFLSVGATPPAGFTLQDRRPVRLLRPGTAGASTTLYLKASSADHRSRRGVAELHRRRARGPRRRDGAHAAPGERGRALPGRARTVQPELPVEPVSPLRVDPGLRGRLHQPTGRRPARLRLSLRGRASAPSQ